MILVNEKVEHISYGLGIVTEEKDDKIWVQFQEKIGNKVFMYPEAFEKSLKAVNSVMESDVLEQLHRKQEQTELDKIEKVFETAELEQHRAELVSAKKKPVSRTTKRKA